MAEMTLEDAARIVVADELEHAVSQQIILLLRMQSAELISGHAMHHLLPFNLDCEVSDCPLMRSDSDG